MRSKPAEPLQSSLEVTVDPRIELLGLVQYLAGCRRPNDVAGKKDPGLDLRFGRWRSHPVVKAYRRTVEKHQGQESYGLILLFMTDPPELGWKRERKLVSASFIEQAGGTAELGRFLKGLRDFARKSDFMSFYAENQERFLLHKRKGEKKISGHDHMGILEEYLGVCLRSRYKILWTLLYAPGRLTSYIIPYPYQGQGRVLPGPFDVFSIAGGEEQLESWPIFVWNEPLYILVEKMHAEHEREFSRLPPRAKEHIVFAVGLRLTMRNLWRDEFDPEQGYLRKEIHPLTRELYYSLQEYEDNRKCYATLSDFYPRLLEVFQGYKDRSRRLAIIR